MRWAVVLLCVLTGSVRANDAGGASAGVTVTAKIVTCNPVVETTGYTVTVRPRDGKAEGKEHNGNTYFPAEVVSIDNTTCDYDVVVSGMSDGHAYNPGVELKDIGATISINSAPGHSGGWTQPDGGTYEMVLTIPAGAKQVLYAGINPVTDHTAYISGSEEGTITLTLSPH